MKSLKPSLRIVIGVLVCLLLSAVAYFWATGMVDSLYAYRSPLRENPPAPGERLGPPATRRVVLVLVDALRYDTAQNAQVMPVLDSLRQKGASAKAHSQTPSYSEPGYSTLLTGGWPYLNDGPVMNLDYDKIPTWTQDNLFSAAARAGMKTAVSGYYWFEKLIPQNSVAAHFYTPGEDRKADREVVDAALPWLADPQGYQLILIHIDQVDYAGHHEGGPQGAAWREAASRADSLIAEITAKLDLTEDTILVFSDHGQIDQGGHGGQDAITLVEPFVMAGAGVRPGVYPDQQMVDLAPTVAALLGLNLPASAQGQVLSAMLSLPEQTAQALPAAQHAQQDQLLRAYAAATGLKIQLPPNQVPLEYQARLEVARSQKLTSERLWRGALALLVLVVTGWLVSRMRGKQVTWLAAGVALYLLAFNLKYAVLDRMTYSFSSVKGSMDLIISIGISTAVAFLIGWLAALIGSRVVQVGAGEAVLFTISLALLVTWVEGLFVLASFVTNGALVTWTLPEPLSFFLGLMGLVQVLFIGLLGLVLAAIAALAASFARGREAKRPILPVG